MKGKFYSIPENLPERKDCPYNFLCCSCFMGCEKQNIPFKECEKHKSWDLQGFLNEQIAQRSAT